MDCKDYERQIPGFIEGSLDYKTQKRFCAHIKQCKSCMEELSIQFLVTEGVHRLESGNAFDLQGDLDQLLAQADRRIRRHQIFFGAGLVLEIAVAGLAAWRILHIFLA